MIKHFFILFLTLVVSTNSLATQSIFDTSASNLFEQKDDEFPPVDQAFVFFAEQKNNLVQVRFEIQPGFYLYRKQFKFKSKNAMIKPVELPQGLDHEDEYFGKQVIYKGNLTFDIRLDSVDNNAELSIRYQGCAEKGLCYPPQTKKIPLTNINNSTANSVLNALGASEETKSADKQSNMPQTVNTNNNVVSEQNRLADMLKQENILLTLLAFFLGGLLLSFTPCVFPMYPILTGIIVGQGKQLTSKSAFLLSFTYVQGMAITYTLLGIVVALAGAQFQAMFQHPAVLISLSVLFIVLALSMFGVYNLSLPASWQQKLNNMSNQQKSGSYWGVALMGIISGLVASPCTTAPLTGALLYISQTGNVVLGAMALYALSLGMGLPLLILGSSGGKLLPKAGAWMEIIKHTFGFLLLAVPVFLLQRILPSLYTELLAITLVLSAATYYYVENQKTKPSFWFGVRSLFIFTAIIGSVVMLTDYLPWRQTTQPQTQANLPSGKFVKVANKTELLQQVKLANAQGKSVMVDLYADWCVACKEFEHYTFFDAKVQRALQNTLMLQIDLTDTSLPDNAQIMQDFQIFGLPSILFFDKNGRELTQQRVTGFMNAEDFSQHINRIFNQESK